MDWVLELRAEVGIPNSLAEIGVTDGHVDRLADMAIEDPSCGGNPIPLTRDALAGLYRAAISGKL